MIIGYRGDDNKLYMPSKVGSLWRDFSVYVVCVCACACAHVHNICDEVLFRHS